jgi:hypothetical protein
MHILKTQKDLKLILYLKSLQKQEQPKLKTSRRIFDNEVKNQWNRDQKTAYKESMEQKAGSLKDK